MTSSIPCRSLIPWFAALLLLGPAAAPAAAQFDAFPWALDTTAGGSGSTSGDAMTIDGPDSGCGTPNHTTSFTTTAPYAGTVVVSLGFFDEDEQQGFDWPVYIVNGVETKVGDFCFGCDLVFDVPAGGTFGFGVHSVDCILGAGIDNLTQLQFIPHDVGPDVHGLAGSAFGTTLAGIGDVNGDNVPDFVVGAPTALTPPTASGSVSLISGADGSTLKLFQGDQTAEAFGAALAAGGDCNGDGVPDLIVGAPSCNTGGTDAGLVRVFSADGLMLQSLVGHIPSDQFGAAVAFVGDVNGDGRDDFVVGAPGHDAAGTNAGMAIVFSGATGATLHSWLGTSPGDQFGTSVAGIGDVNGDGVPDLVVGAPLHGNSSGTVGSASILSGASGAVLHLLEGAGDVQNHFGARVAAAGDVDGDGTPDVIVGAPDVEEYFANGSAVVLSGKTGAALFMFVGKTNGDHLGWSVAGAGDLDGDGHADLLVGEPQPQGVDQKGGRAFLFSGRDGSLLAAVVGASPFDALGTAVAGIGDVDGDDHPDFVVGDPDDVGGAGRAAVVEAKLLWSYLGGGLAGVNGTPLLIGKGLLAGDTPIALTLSHAVGHAPATVIVGFHLLQAPFKGGVVMPSVDDLISGLNTGTTGGFTLSGSWPPGVPSGLPLYLQTWIADPAGPAGFAATQGLKLVTP